MHENLKSILFEKEKNLKELPREFLLYQEFLHFKFDQILIPALVLHEKEEPQICGLKYQILKHVPLNQYRHPADKSTVYLDIKNILGTYCMSCDVIKEIEIINESGNEGKNEIVKFEILLDDKVIEKDNIFYFLDIGRDSKIKISNAENINLLRIVFTNYLLSMDVRRALCYHLK